MEALTPQLAKYGLIGVVNTVLTLFVISALTLLDVNPYFSNAVGFLVGLLNSFLLNSRYTFKKKASTSAAMRFSGAFILSYLINLGVLYFLISSFNIPSLLSQFVAMIAYNIAFFILMKAWVFSRD